MRQSNVTVEGYEYATPVDDPQIGEVIDLDHGTTPDAKELIASQLYQDLVDNRVNIVERMNTDDPRYLCAECLTPVYLVSTTDKRFFFRHRSEADDSCSAKTRSPLTAEEITARKYHGLRESQPHKRIKGLIERSLMADSSFSDVAVERNWKGAESKRYRRPDVQAGSANGKVAFEVQLSTTFLSVVAGRRTFYRNEGGLLVWIFGSFDAGYRRLTTDDLLYSNNSNIFIVDEETTVLSEQTGVFHVRCHHRVPVRRGSQIADEWAEQIVSFHDLTQDRDGQRIFLFDFQATDMQLRSKISREAEEREAMKVWADQADLRDFWNAHGRSFRHTPENRAIWQQLRERFANRGIPLPQYPDIDDDFKALLSGLYSAKQGEPVGYNFANLIQVAHQIAEHRPGVFVPFYCAIQAFEKLALLKEQDTSGKWRARLIDTVKNDERVPGIFSRIKAGDPAFLLDANLLPLLRFVFPEVAPRVERFLSGQ